MIRTLAEFVACAALFVVLTLALVVILDALT